MKIGIKFLVAITLCLNVKSADAQSVANTNCEMALQICEFTHQTFNFNDEDGHCLMEPLYYSFNFDAMYNNSVNLSVTGGASWEWFGAFSSTSLDACAQIANYSATSETGSFAAGGSVNLDNSSSGIYILKVIPLDCSGTVTVNSGIGDVVLICDAEMSCQDCITSFSPSAGKYIVSAWVKEEGASNTVTTYTEPSIEITFSGVSGSPISLQPQGEIIDGWQRIEEEIEVPIGATGIDLQLTVTSGDAYFDDIRFFPFDGSMMSYVYDPLSLRLMAELDERNYATLYEYDEEGKLVRVKKETEKGIMTIQENRDNIKKQ